MDNPKKSPIQVVGDCLTKVNKAVSFVAVLPMFLIMILAVLDVVAGKVFGRSIQSSTEMIQYLNVPLVCLAMGYVEHQMGHTRIQVLTKFYPKVVRKALYVLGSLIGCGISFYVAYMAVKPMMTYIQRMTPIQTTSPIPVWPFTLCLIIGYVLTGLSFLWSAVREIRKKDEPKPAMQAAQKEEV